MSVVTLDPQVSQRNRRWELLIWIIDLASYAFLGASGVIALFFTSDFVLKEVKWTAAIVVWGCLLLGGGIAGFLGRLTRRWWVELLGNVAAASGAAVYVIIIVSAIITNGSTMVLLAFVLVAFLMMLRRYAELQIFTSDPGLGTFTSRVLFLLRRRTENVVRRKHF